MNASKIIELLKNPCGVCGADVEAIVANEASSHYVRCRSCGCVSVVGPALRSDDLSVYANDYSAVLNAGNQRESYARLFHWVKDALFYALPEEKGNFLEVGFANAAVLVEAKKSGRFMSVSGVDISCPAFVRQDLFTAGVDVRLGDFCDPRVGTWGECSLVWATHVIEHMSLAKVGVFLDKVRQSLAPNGIFFTSSPDASMYGTEAMSMLIGHLKPNEHKILYTPDVFADIARKHGFVRLWVDAYWGIHGDRHFFTSGEWRQCFIKAP